VTYLLTAMGYRVGSMRAEAAVSAAA